MKIIKTILKVLGIILLVLIVSIVAIGCYVYCKSTSSLANGDAIGHITAITCVGDNGLEVRGFDIVVNDKAVLEGLSAKDFDIVNNTVTTYLDTATGKTPEDFADDEIEMQITGDTIRLRARPFAMQGKAFFIIAHTPWEVHCTNPRLSFNADAIDQKLTDVIDDCLYGQHTYAGITREYLLYLPRDSDGVYLKGVPLMIWNIGGTEYGMPIKEAVLSDRAMVTMADAGQPCAALKFGLANPNYEFSASLDPEKIKMIDRNNAVQMSLIDSLIQVGIVDSTRVYCCGASSGGGATMRFCMQFPDRLAAAIPCCSMDPIIPIHYAEEAYEGQFVHDMKEAFAGDVYKWDGEDMALAPIDQQAFLDLPIRFVHAREDIVCKVTSSETMYEARRQMGALNDRIDIYSPEVMESYGEGGFLHSHYSWVPVLNNWEQDSPMRWMLEKER